MKILMNVVIFLVYLMTAFAQTSIVNAHDVKNYIGKEITVCGTLYSVTNSSYAQTAFYYLGSDSSHKELSVVVQGKLYTSGTVWVRKYIGKKILIKGIVHDHNGVYLEATESLRVQE